MIAQRLTFQVPPSIFLVYKHLLQTNFDTQEIIFFAKIVSENLHTVATNLCAIIE